MTLMRLTSSAVRVRQAIKRKVRVVRTEYVQAKVNELETAPVSIVDFLHDTSLLREHVRPNVRSSPRHDCASEPESNATSSCVVAEWQDCYCVCHSEGEEVCFYQPDPRSTHVV